MDTIRLSSKGRFALPKAIRDANGWGEGTMFMVERVAGGVLLRPLRPVPPTRLEDVLGSADYRGPARSITRMATALERGVKGHRGSNRR
jgi:AbrB family looped-hinge helix DNA binding protein